MSEGKQPPSRSGRRVVVGLILSVGIVLSGAPASQSAVYVPPTGSAPTGSTPLLNVSESDQVKAGPLTFDGGLIVSSPTGNPSLEAHGRICWNGDCQTVWPNGSVTPGSYVQLGAVNNGWVDVVGRDGTVSPYALSVTSGIPQIGSSTYAAYGQSNPGSLLFSSYGVYAAAGADAPQNYALYGTATSATAWAGSFAGNVAVAPPFDLLVGGTITQGPSATTGELCLNDSCRSTWPTVSDTYWNDTGSTYETLDPTWSVAVGGSDSNAYFFLQMHQTGDVLLRASGAGRSSDLTIQ